LPARIDWKGKHHPRTFKELVNFEILILLIFLSWKKIIKFIFKFKSNLFQHIPPNFLLQLCNQTFNLLDERLQFSISNSNTLLGSGQFSILQSKFNNQNQKLILLLNYIFNKNLFKKKQIYNKQIKISLNPQIMMLYQEIFICKIFLPIRTILIILNDLGLVERI